MGIFVPERPGQAVRGGQSTVPTTLDSLIGLGHLNQVVEPDSMTTGLLQPAPAVGAPRTIASMRA